jgi:hypothetical protein
LGPAGFGFLVFDLVVEVSCGDLLAALGCAFFLELEVLLKFLGFVEGDFSFCAASIANSWVTRGELRKFINSITENIYFGSPFIIEEGS